jgi:hypothetical protein
MYFASFPQRMQQALLIATPFDTSMTLPKKALEAAGQRIAQLEAEADAAKTTAADKVSPTLKLFRMFCSFKYE